MTEIVIEQKELYNVLVHKQDGYIYITQSPDIISIKPENIPALISALQQLTENQKTK